MLSLTAVELLAVEIVFLSEMSRGLDPETRFKVQGSRFKVSLFVT